MGTKNTRIALFCKGEGKRFKQRCQFYQSLSDECRLLKEWDLREVFEEEESQCKPYERLKEAVDKFSRKYSNTPPRKEDIETITFELSLRIKKQRLKKGWTLAFLLSYLRSAAKNEVLGRLQIEKELLKNRCEDCCHLSLSTPHTCQRPSIRTPEGDEIENPLYDQKRNPSDKACPQGFEPCPHRDVSLDEIPPPSVEPAEINVSESSENYEPEYEIVLSIQRLFSERAAAAKGERKEIDEYQYLMICRLFQLIEEGYTQREAMRRIDEEFGIHKRKRQRYFKEIREFLREKGVVKSGKDHLLIIKGAE